MSTGSFPTAILNFRMLFPLWFHIRPQLLATQIVMEDVWSTSLPSVDGKHELTKPQRGIRPVAVPCMPGPRHHPRV
jgi:hypothetical protein